MGIWDSFLEGRINKSHKRLRLFAPTGTSLGWGVKAQKQRVYSISPGLILPWKSLPPILKMMVLFEMILSKSLPGKKNKLHSELPEKTATAHNYCLEKKTKKNCYFPNVFPRIRP